MTLNQAFGTGNVTATTVSGVTKVTFKKSLFDEISVAEAHPTTGDIRKVVYGMMKGLIGIVNSEREKDRTLTSVVPLETYQNLYPSDDTQYSAQMVFSVAPLVNDVKDEP
jgi:hypothetical protein